VHDVTEPLVVVHPVPNNKLVGNEKAHVLSLVVNFPVLIGFLVKGNTCLDLTRPHAVELVTELHHRPSSVQHVLNDNDVFAGKTFINLRNLDIA
jgi:hypothetical protein